MPKPFVSASAAQEHNSARDCWEHTCCLKARFERETFRLPTCWKYLSDLITSYQPCEPGPAPEMLRDGQQEVRTAKPQIRRQLPLAERPLPPGKETSVDLQRGRGWPRAAQGQAGHKLQTALWRQAVPCPARHKPMLLPGPRLWHKGGEIRDKRINAQFYPLMNNMGSVFPD